MEENSSLVEIQVPLSEYYVKLLNDLMVMLYVIISNYIVEETSEIKDLIVGTFFGYFFSNLIGRHLIRFVTTKKTP